jgi:hypothetical protein
VKCFRRLYSVSGVLNVFRSTFPLVSVWDVTYPLSVVILVESCIIKIVRLILNKLHSVRAQKELHKVLVAHLLAAAGQRHSLHKNGYDDRVYFFAQYILTNVIVEVGRYTTLLLSVGTANIFSMIVSILFLYEISRISLGVHGPPIQNRYPMFMPRHHNINIINICNNFGECFLSCGSESYLSVWCIKTLRLTYTKSCFTRFVRVWNWSLL